jgi:hypothetical protein
MEITTDGSLKPEDALAIEQQCDAVKSTSPSVNTRAQVVYSNKNWNTSIQGTGHLYPEIRNWEIDQGTYFDANQVKAGAKVCVLGSEVKKNLFEDEDPIGATTYKTLLHLLHRHVLKIDPSARSRCPPLGGISHLPIVVPPFSIASS